jgi:hypothetical protein
MSVALIEDKLSKIKFLVEHSRLLEAQKEAISLRELGKSCCISDAVLVNETIEAHRELLTTIKDRAEELERIVNMCSSDHAGWTLGSEMFGVNTYYRLESDGQLSVRMEGVQDIPIFEQIIVFYECALYNEWIPFCNRSELLHKISK